MIVVLDTNALYGDVYANGGWIDSLFRAAESEARLEVWTPASVVEELVRQFPERLNDIRSLLRKHGHSLSAFGLERPALPQSIDDLTGAYRPHLQDRLQGPGRTVVAHPPSVGVAIDWVAQRRKPIKANGTGAVDAAVWLTVLEAAKVDKHVVLISSNTEDFADPSDKSKPHPVLREDIAALNRNDLTVELKPRVLDFNNAFLAPLEEATQVAHALLADGGSREAIIAQIVDAVEWFPLELTGWGLDAEIDESMLEEFSVDDLTLIRADPAARGTYLTLTVVGTARCDLGLFKSEAYALRDDSPIKVYDYDWNESMAAAEIELPAELLVEVLHEDGELSVSIVEISPRG